MSNLPVDRDPDYMYQMWGTKQLITDYTQTEKKVIKEIMYDDTETNKFKLTENIHSKIRNDNDYDDWEYGTEPIYGIPWKN